MCGICGIYHFDRSQNADPSTLETMTRTMHHRGPDDEGFHIDGHMGFGFRRLSIIDLAGGHQPMSDYEESIWVVFNGEIYNFKEIRQELEARGHRFRTQCDTEVIIYAYKQWGDDFLHRLNGMFGLAVWDVKRQRMVIARDRMGIKLVYYHLNNHSLAFGSEIRPVIASGTASKDIDIAALNLFLRFRYTPSPLTLYKGIRKLPPGAKLIVENGSAREERWYDFHPQPFRRMPSLPEAREELISLYRQAVKRQLISDVPLGLLLSGGMDSGLLLSLMSEFDSGWQTYSVGYGKSFKDDELEDAAATAAHFKASNAQVRIDREEFERSLPQIIAALEEPIASSSIVPMYHVCERARADLKVALIGQGPDEMFGGYLRHLGVCYGKYWRSMPTYSRQVLKRVLPTLHRSETLRRSLFSLDESDRLLRYRAIFSLLPGDEINSLFHNDLLPPNPDGLILDCWKDLIPHIADVDEMTGFNFLELNSTLPDELLMYADKLSMAHSLELRVPYLDHDIVEYVLRLDKSYKIRFFSRKFLHKKSASEILPETIINRRKRGFAVNVVDQWFREAMDSRLDEILRDPTSHVYDFFDYDNTMDMYKAHQDGRADYHKIIFSIVCLEYWLDLQT